MTEKEDNDEKRRIFGKTAGTAVSDHVSTGSDSTDPLLWKLYSGTDANGRSEEEVLTELGDPLLIAKTLMDVQETQEEYSHPETNIYEERGGQESSDIQRELHRMEIKTRGGCLLAAVIFVVVVAMILWAAGTVLIHLLPILIPLMIVLLVVAYFKQK